MKTKAKLRSNPHPLLLATEPLRIAQEVLLLAATDKRLRRMPRGDGHVVIVMPGFMGDDSFNGSLIRYLQAMGYAARGWGRGRNMGPSDENLEAMATLIEKEFTRSGRKVSLIGHSLGGIYARELSRLFPEKVRLVISLGSPFSYKDDFVEPPIAKIFRRFNPDMSDFEENRANMRQPLDVPYTAVFSRGDGIVHWTQCVQHDGTAQTENVRVAGSHSGLVLNPAVRIVIADRLAQPEGHWKRFKIKRARRLLFPHNNGDVRRARFNDADEVRSWVPTKIRNVVLGPLQTPS